MKMRLSRAMGREQEKTAGNTMLPAVFTLQAYCPLAVSATVGSAATTEPTPPSATADGASAMVSTAAADGASTMESITSGVAACGAATSIVTSIAAPIVPARIPPGIAPSVTPGVTASIAPTGITEAAATPVPTMTPVIPRSGTDEYSTRKPLRTIEAIRCTGIGIIGVVPIWAYRRSVNVARVGIALVGVTLVSVTLVAVTLVDSDANSRFNLRLRVSKR